MFYDVISCEVCLVVSSHDGVMTLITVTLIMIDCSHPFCHDLLMLLQTILPLYLTFFSQPLPHFPVHSFFCSGSLLGFITLNLPIFLLLKLLAVTTYFFVLDDS